MRVSMNRQRRSGITLIEVLFAIGVVVVGLLGVVALIPLAGVQARIGIDNDKAHLVGRAAIQDFDVYGMRRQVSWAYWNQMAGAFQRYNPLPTRESFCLDPRLIATHAVGSPMVLPPPSRPAQFFPSVDIAGVAGPPMTPLDTRMRRVTLVSAPGSNFPMTLAQANHYRPRLRSFGNRT